VTERYELLLAGPARRALAEELPLKVAAAVWGLINADMLDEPRRVGKPLHARYLGHWVARRSTYRVRYRIDDDKHTVIVLDVRARADVYRWPGQGAWTEAKTWGKR
jgi:mRNA interferase RelE/StbE